MRSTESNSNLFLQSFNNDRLSERIISLNKQLMFFLNRKKSIKELLTEYFDQYLIFTDGLRTFRLAKWYDGERNQTLELVEVEEGQIKFGMTLYGALCPLEEDNLILKHQIEEVISDFYNEPLKYFCINYTQNRNS